MRPAAMSDAGQRQRRDPAVVEADHRDDAALGRRRRPRRPAVRTPPPCWSAASRPARACPRPAPPRRSRRAGGRACRCRRCGCRRARARSASRSPTPASRRRAAASLTSAGSRPTSTCWSTDGHVGVEGADVAPGVGVGLAHEGVADDGDSESVVSRRFPLVGECAEEGQPVAGEVVLRGCEWPPDGRRGGDRGVVGGEALDVQRAGVADLVQRRDQRRPVGLVAARRAAVAAADLQVREVLAGGADRVRRWSAPRC